MNIPSKLVAHKKFCFKCRKSDGIKQLCRIGRRLFIAWFETLDQDARVMWLFGLPKEMQDEIIEATNTEGIVMGHPVHSPGGN